MPFSAEPDIPITDPLCAVFRRHLRSLNQKYTPERAQILDSLLELDDVFEADTLQKALKNRGRRVSKATIYRTIKLLQGAGIIQKVMFDSEQAHFQLAYGRRPRELLVRIDTGQIIPIDLPELASVRDLICRDHGLSPQSHRFQIFAVASHDA